MSQSFFHERIGRDYKNEWSQSQQNEPAKGSYQDKHGEDNQNWRRLITVLAFSPVSSRPFTASEQKWCTFKTLQQKNALSIEVNFKNIFVVWKVASILCNFKKKLCELQFTSFSLAEYMQDTPFFVSRVLQLGLGIMLQPATEERPEHFIRQAGQSVCKLPLPLLDWMCQWFLEICLVKKQFSTFITQLADCRNNCLCLWPITFQCPPSTGFSPMEIWHQPVEKNCQFHPDLLIVCQL